MLSYLKDLLMGNNSSNQFLRALRHGDHVKASELYHTKVRLKENLQPNLSLGVEHNDNTLLHYAALYGMEQMYSDLISRQGKPDMKNCQRRNCLHLICLCSTVRGIEDHTKCAMLELTFKEGLHGMDIKHLLAEKDENGNTALHLAAGAGLQQCVDLLITYEADMVATNEEGQTPADLAKTRHHGHIATGLEAKMVFSHDDDLVQSLEPDPELLEEIAEEPIGMHDKALRSMKDALLIETSEMLGVSLQSAEVLLKHYGWSKEELLQAWVENSERVCELTGLQLAQDASRDFLSAELSGLSVTMGDEGVEDEMMSAECGICCASCDLSVQVPCAHHFCRDCWKEYLEQKIAMGESQSISCPAYGCYKLVPLEVIEGVVSQDMAVKFLSFDIKAFVDSNPNIRWCPHPGCSQAVSRPPLPDENTHLSPSHSGGEVKGQTVPCGNGHYFCWECLGEAHEPCSCAQWQRWLDHCNEMKPRIGETTAAEANAAATSKWLVDYSKPCPKCKSPIEKTEGCNHMCCKYCRHDFCWVCMDDWKCHNSSTGGYFNCNRYDAQHKAVQYLDQRKQEVLRDCKDWEQMSKFLHFYERYKEHIKSHALEEPFLNKAQEKMIELAHSIQHLELRSQEDREDLNSHHGSVRSRQLDLSFIQDAVQELLKCRRVLKATYCYGYYLTGIISKKQFEHMQGALEQVTEMLAEAVARPHLRKPRLEIIRLTREAREKRAGLVKNVHSGLPLSSHPFLSSAGPLVGRSLWDNGSSTSHSNARLRRFLHDLDTYIPPDHRSQVSLETQQSYRADSDNDLLQVLEMSRREHEADKKLLADMELAKTLSLRQGHSLPSGSPPPPSNPPTQATPTLPMDSIIDHVQDQDASSWSTLPPSIPLEPPSLYSPVLPPPREELGVQSPPAWVQSSEWSGEDEDMNRAIRESLQLNFHSSDHVTSKTDTNTVDGHFDGGPSSQGRARNDRKDMLVIGCSQRKPLQDHRAFVGQNYPPTSHVTPLEERLQREHRKDRQNMLQFTLLPPSHLDHNHRGSSSSVDPNPRGYLSSVDPNPRGYLSSVDPNPRGYPSSVDPNGYHFPFLDMDDTVSSHTHKGHTHKGPGQSKEKPELPQPLRQLLDSDDRPATNV